MSITDNIKKVRENIPENVTLIDVSKTRSNEEILEAYNYGERHFGENKVQEMCGKYEELPKDIKWHLIGRLQRNKVKYIVGKVHLIHSVDNTRLVEEIEKKYSSKGEIANILLQVNIGREEVKSGILEENLDELIAKVEECSNIKVKGLMTILPIGSKEENRKYFKKMKDLFDNLKEREFKNISLDVLSMGMSNDYVTAIEEGSTMVRVGRSIFGERSYK